MLLVNKFVSNRND